MKKIFYILLLIFSAVSCKIDDIELFGDERFISFDDKDAVFEKEFSFRYAEGKTEDIIRVPVRYSGKPYGEDREFRIVVNVSDTDAQPEEYSVEQKQMFKTGSFKDTVLVTVRKTSRMDGMRVKLSLNLVSNENFSADFKDAETMTLIITNKLSKPSWWNEDIEKSYLGKYTDKKLELFLEHGYNGDFGILSPSEKRDKARKFKYWLLENPTKDEDGMLIDVPVVG